MIAEYFIKAEIASFAYHEAAHMGGHQAMVAVACILQNRVRAGWAAGDWQTILNLAEESSATEPRPRGPLDLTPHLRRVLQEIDEIYAGVYPDNMTTGLDEKKKPVRGLYFMDALCESRGATLRPWFREKILGDPYHHPRIAQVGMMYIFS
jgi:hypothetical protein